MALLHGDYSLQGRIQGLLRGCNIRMIARSARKFLEHAPFPENHAHKSPRSCMICNSGSKQLQNSIFGASNRYLKLKLGVICRLNITMLSGRVYKVASCSIICMLMVLRLAWGGGVHVHPMHPTGSAPEGLKHKQWQEEMSSE